MSFTQTVKFVSFENEYPRKPQRDWIEFQHIKKTTCEPECRRLICRVESRPIASFLSSSINLLTQRQHSCCFYRRCPTLIALCLFRTSACAARALLKCQKSTAAAASAAAPGHNNRIALCLFGHKDDYGRWLRGAPGEVALVPFCVTGATVVCLWIYSTVQL